MDDIPPPCGLTIPACSDNTGDITVPENIDYFANLVKTGATGPTDTVLGPRPTPCPDGVDLVLADGHINTKGTENIQEYLLKHLVLCQAALALEVLRPGGTLVLKVGDLFSRFSVHLVYLMHLHFESFVVDKSIMIRASSCDRYIIFKNFRLREPHLADTLLEVAGQLSSMVGSPCYKGDGRRNDMIPSPQNRAPDIVELVDDAELQTQAAKPFRQHIQDMNETLAYRQWKYMLGMKEWVELTNTGNSPAQMDPKKAEARCFQLWGLPATPISFRSNRAGRAGSMMVGVGMGNQLPGRGPQRAPQFDASHSVTDLPVQQARHHGSHLAGQVVPALQCDAACLAGTAWLQSQQQQKANRAQKAAAFGLMSVGLNDTSSQKDAEKTVPSWKQRKAAQAAQAAQSGKSLAPGPLCRAIKSAQGHAQDPSGGPALGRRPALTQGHAQAQFLSQASRSELQTSSSGAPPTKPPRQAPPIQQIGTKSSNDTSFSLPRKKPTAVAVVSKPAALTTPSTQSSSSSSKPVSPASKAGGTPSSAARSFHSANSAQTDSNTELTEAETDALLGL
eukprot:gene9906-1786_t